MFEIFEHTADQGLRVRAPSVPELFQDAARGLSSLLAPNLDQVRLLQERTISLDSNDREYLLLDWLQELLYAFETERLVFADFQVVLLDSSLRATCRGEQFDAERHGAGTEVKAITYHGLTIRRQCDGWLAELIVDI